MTLDRAGLVATTFTNVRRTTSASLGVDAAHFGIDPLEPFFVCTR